MTLEQTRQLGIEFERRVQTMIPEKEYDKLDTETIFSFLNLYQDKYIHDIYRNLDSIQSGTKLSARVESILLALLISEEISIDEAISNETNISDTSRSVTYPLSELFYMYVRSVSKVNTSFNFKNNKNTNVQILPNELVSLNDVWRLIETPHNNLRILRHPAAVLSEYGDDEKKDAPTITVIYDLYTEPLGIKVLYYSQPAYFDLMSGTACKLPMDVFEDLVSGAVDLYVQYVVGAEARKRQLQEEAKLRQLQQKQNNEQQ